MDPLQHVLHMSLLIITGKILLQYVFAYVSSDNHFRKILPNTPCKKSFFSLQYVFPYMYLDYFPVKILHHTLYSYMAFLQYVNLYVALGYHFLKTLLNIPCRYIVFLPHVFGYDT